MEGHGADGSPRRWRSAESCVTQTRGRREGTNRSDALCKSFWVLDANPSSFLCPPRGGPAVCWCGAPYCDRWLSAPEGGRVTHIETAKSTASAPVASAALKRKTHTHPLWTSHGTISMLARFNVFAIYVCTLRRVVSLRKIICNASPTMMCQQLRWRAPYLESK